VSDVICKSLEIAEKPERETPEEFENRAGRPWSDDSAVYMRVGKNGWRTASYREAKFAAECCEGRVPCRIYCANSDAGIPGPSEYAVSEFVRERNYER
jgi:hypothetical protein